MDNGLRVVIVGFSGRTTRVDVARREDELFKLLRLELSHCVRTKQCVRRMLLHGRVYADLTVRATKRATTGSGLLRSLSAIIIWEAKNAQRLASPIK